MRISSVKIIAYQLLLKQPWKTVRDKLASRQGWLLELSTDSGLAGYGDCAPLTSVGTETQVQALDWLQSHSHSLLHHEVTPALQQLPVVTKTPAARCAIETALLDLSAQQSQQSLRHWLNPDAVDSIAVNSMSGSLSQHSEQAVLHSIEAGYSVVKLKIGLQTVQQDIQSLQQLAGQLPAHVRLRLDANGAFDYRQAETLLEAVAGLPIEAIEEPLGKPDLASLASLQRHTDIVLALDESITTFQHGELLQQQPVRRLVIKPMAHGGLLASLALAQQAAAHNMECVISSSIETEIGLQAAAQLAAALPATQPAHGLATADWLQQHVAATLTIQQGRLWLNQQPGLGLAPYHDVLAQPAEVATS